MQWKRRTMLVLHDVLVHPVIGIIKAISPSTRNRFGEWLHDLTVPPLSTDDRNALR